MAIDATPMQKNPGGRRPGESGTREAILDAALALFAERGYDGASLRAIAGRAEVDPGLIRHFFGDKDALFAKAVADRTTIPERIAAAVGTDLSTAGRAVTDAYLRLWDESGTRPILLALVRSATTSDRAAQMLRDVLGGDTRAAGFDADRTRRVALAGSHLFGVAMTRHVIRLAPIVELSHEELVDEIAPTIQRYLTG
ncbi:TetR family transcriptional regulator [Cellulomonas sp. McL0617]|uniref:TetR/AcrR family transcriptional regulator n=1 Tax=Cellulomonas sp. McL0617 TaxID=3415675 RepID=UPI003CEF34D6